MLAYEACYECKQFSGHSIVAARTHNCSKVASACSLFWPHSSHLAQHLPLVNAVQTLKLCQLPIVVRCISHRHPTSADMAGAAQAQCNRSTATRQLCQRPQAVLQVGAAAWLAALPAWGQCFAARRPRGGEVARSHAAGAEAGKHGQPK